MSSRKYAGDYRLENVPGRSGKLKTVAVYRGAEYFLQFRPELFAALRQQIKIAVGVYWVSQLASFLLNTRLARCAWVVMPQAFSLLPFGYLTVGVMMLMKAQEPMTREYAEKMRDRFSGGSLIASVFCGAAFIGALVGAIILRAELKTASDIIYIILLAISLAACVVCFRGRRCVQIKAQEPEADRK